MKLSALCPARCTLHPAPYSLKDTNSSLANGYLENLKLK
jgi:hypothetical protein